ncbi:MAG TPA: SRPBCC family protein [Salinimicrobium sp.]|nr:SRPBCC family protein [Salinimicrobium sp.]
MNHLFSRGHINVSRAERLLSVMAGAGFLFNALRDNRKNIAESLLGGYLLYRGGTGHCLFYDALGKTKPDNRSRNVNIQITQIVDKPRKEVYNAWRNLENLPLFMEHLESVQNLTQNISEWVVNIPGGVWHIRWKGEIVKEIPDELLGWQSLPGSNIENAGKIEFKDAPNGGTEVHAVISYHAPFGIPGEGAARMFNSYFEELVREDILNFKDFIEYKEEAGESAPGNLNYGSMY